jgi:hypothetical protein
MTNTPNRPDDISGIKIHGAVRALEAKYARAQGCLLRIHELIAGGPPPGFEPDPEVIVLHVAALIEENRKLRGELYEETEGVPHP